MSANIDIWSERVNRKGSSRVAKTRVVITGAGMGGLAAAIHLASKGAEVTVCERAPTPGGKMRQVSVGGAMIDAGPTVLTLKGVFESLFDGAGETLSHHVRLLPCSTLARHAWSESAQLDLHADRAASVDAIARFAGPSEAARYLGFCRDAARTWRALEGPFIRQPHPSLKRLLLSSGASGWWALGRANPFASMWRALGRRFRDARLQQLFGRYATYCGSSPFHAPATLTLVAHVEQSGVWLVEGGMYRLAEAMAELAERQGATLRLSTEIRSVDAPQGHVRGVTLASGEQLPAEAVILNADASGVAAGLLGVAAAQAVTLPPRRERSLSAVTWNLVARTKGLALHRHTVFFSRDYKAEFDALFARGEVPPDPTVYVCAQDRGDEPGPSPDEPERLLCLVNAPADGDTPGRDPARAARSEAAAFAQLERCGLHVERDPRSMHVTTPHDFEGRFPGSGGALYGMASHGWRSAFQRPGCRTRLPGLYLAGGSAHPGPGVPMAALSGRMAAEAVLSDLASTRR